MPCSNSSAIIINGELYRCGKNDRGQLGNGTTSDIPRFTKLEGFQNIKQVLMGDNYCILLLENGDVYSSGDNTRGQLGLNKSYGNFVTTFTKVNISNIDYINTNFSTANALQYQSGNGVTPAYKNTKWTNTVFLTKDGDIYVCGTNPGRYKYGQVIPGYPLNEIQYEPVLYDNSDIDTTEKKFIKPIGLNGCIVWAFTNDCRYFTRIYEFDSPSSTNKYNYSYAKLTKYDLSKFKIYQSGSQTINGGILFYSDFIQGLAAMKNMDGSLCSESYYNSRGQGLLGVNYNSRITGIVDDSVGIIKVQAQAQDTGITVFLKENGTLYGCGYGGNYQFGNNSSSDNTTRKIIATGVKDFYLGEKHLLVLKEDGLYVCGICENYSCGNSYTGVCAPLIKHTFDNDNITNLSIGSNTSKYLYKDDKSYFHYDKNNKREDIKELNYCNREIDVNEDFSKIDLNKINLFKVIKFDKDEQAFLCE